MYEVDWTKSMEQSFEYYEVDPISWKDIKRIDNIKSSSITRDLSADTLGSATIDIVDSVGECYIRIYLVVIQNEQEKKFPLGTYLVQTPTTSFDGKIMSVSMNAYTPLLELKENNPPLGYSLLTDQNVMEAAYSIVREHVRCPVVKTESDVILTSNFVSNTNDKWLTFVRDLINIAKYDLGLDDMGRIIFTPIQSLAALQPVWTFDDGNSSILYPEITLKHDIYGIPNVVEVTCDTGTSKYTARIVNDDPNSPTSTVNRGREILYREDDPNLPGYSTEEAINEYATKLLESLSSVEYQVSYTHGYCPVRVGDAVRLNYKRAGLENIKAKVINQTINCEKGCSVSETAVFTKKLWN